MVYKYIYIYISEAERITATQDVAIVLVAFLIV